MPHLHRHAVERGGIHVAIRIQHRGRVVARRRAEFLEAREVPVGERVGRRVEVHEQVDAVAQAERRVTEVEPVDHEASVVDVVVAITS